MTEGKLKTCIFKGISGFGAMGALVVGLSLTARADEDPTMEYGGPQRSAYPTALSGANDSSGLVVTTRTGYFDFRSLVLPSDEPTAFVGRNLLRVDNAAFGFDGFRPPSFRDEERWRQIGAPLTALNAGPQPEQRVYATVELGNPQLFQVNSRFGGFDIDVAPRANISFGESGGGAGGGALVRVGQNLVESGGGPQSGQWFLFAGAGSEALTWRPNTNAFVSDGGMAVEEMMLIGDAHAGIAWRIGTADVALAYVHREFSARNVDFNENFAGLTITWSH